MICIIAGNHLEAKRWAEGQNLSNDEWFYPTDIYELSKKTNFHVIVIGSAGENVPQSYFNRIYTYAKSQGRIGR